MYLGVIIWKLLLVFSFNMDRILSYVYFLWGLDACISTLVEMNAIHNFLRFANGLRWSCLNVSDKRFFPSFFLVASRVKLDGENEKERKYQSG